MPLSCLPLEIKDSKKRQNVHGSSEIRVQLMQLLLLQLIMTWSCSPHELQEGWQTDLNILVTLNLRVTLITALRKNSRAEIAENYSTLYHIKPTRSLIVIFLGMMNNKY